MTSSLDSSPVAPSGDRSSLATPSSSLPREEEALQHDPRSHLLIGAEAKQSLAEQTLAKQRIFPAFSPMESPADTPDEMSRDNSLHGHKGPTWEVPTAESAFDDSVSQASSSFRLSPLPNSHYRPSPSPERNSFSTFSPLYPSSTKSGGSSQNCRVSPNAPRVAKPRRRPGQGGRKAPSAGGCEPAVDDAAARAAADEARRRKQAEVGGWDGDEDMSPPSGPEPKSERIPNGNEYFDDEDTQGGSPLLPVTKLSAHRLEKNRSRRFLLAASKATTLSIDVSEGGSTAASTPVQTPSMAASRAERKKKLDRSREARSRHSRSRGKGHGTERRRTRNGEREGSSKHKGEPEKALHEPDTAAHVAGGARANGVAAEKKGDRLSNMKEMKPAAILLQKGRKAGSNTIFSLPPRDIHRESNLRDSGDALRKGRTGSGCFNIPAVADELNSPSAMPSSPTHPSSSVDAGLTSASAGPRSGVLAPSGVPRSGVLAPSNSDFKTDGGSGVLKPTSSAPGSGILSAVRRSVMMSSSSADRRGAEEPIDEASFPDGSSASNGVLANGAISAPGHEPFTASSGKLAPRPMPEKSSGASKPAILYTSQTRVAKSSRSFGGPSAANGIGRNPNFAAVPGSTKSSANSFHSGPSSGKLAPTNALPPPASYTHGMGSGKLAPYSGTLPGPGSGKLAPFAEAPGSGQLLPNSSWQETRSRAGRISAYVAHIRRKSQGSIVDAEAEPGGEGGGAGAAEGGKGEVAEGTGEGGRKQWRGGALWRQRSDDFIGGMDGGMGEGKRLGGDSDSGPSLSASPMPPTPDTASVPHHHRGGSGMLRPSSNLGRTFGSLQFPDVVTFTKEGEVAGTPHDASGLPRRGGSGALRPSRSFCTDVLEESHRKALPERVVHEDTDDDGDVDEEWNRMSSRMTSCLGIGSASRASKVIFDNSGNAVGRSSGRRRLISRLVSLSKPSRRGGRVTPPDEALEGRASPPRG
eukprot:TRINITY_DN15048_c0_g1_i1.p1 TRINITY_DN15048_c0_g1~~TRINITY_DN15048_c0_g1_i1.p1  ORF type:complete len:978 (-),score=136.04 TRINITY_DN15048_c0_g1_i1:2363-5296(-)